MERCLYGAYNRIALAVVVEIKLLAQKFMLILEGFNTEFPDSIPDLTEGLKVFRKLLQN